MSGDGSCSRRNEGPQPVTNRTISNGTVSTRRNWLTPVVLDPNVPTTIYYGGNQLNKNNKTGALPGSPVAGAFFPAEFTMLLNNAYPPLS